MFVILTTKPGVFRTEGGEGIRPVETYEYSFGGRVRARFTIAALERETRVRVVDEAPPALLNLVPSKFLEKFASVEDAQRELRHLTAFGRLPAALRKVETAAAC